MIGWPELLKKWMENINLIRLKKLKQGKILYFGLLLVFLFACDSQAPEESVKHEPFTILIQKKTSETPSGGLTTEPYLQGIQRELKINAVMFSFWQEVEDQWRIYGPLMKKS